MNRLRRKLKKRHNNRSKKLCIIIFLILLFLLLKFINSFFISTPHYEIKEVSSFLEHYFTLEETYEIEWYYFASMDDLKNKLGKAKNDTVYEELYNLYISNERDVDRALVELKGENYKKKVLKTIARFKQIDKVYRNKEFPLPKDILYTYEDGWGAQRSYGGERSHEGIDIIADKGVPILSVGDGIITNIGWNEFGGWRIGITGDDGVYYYYAHMDSYQEEMEKGQEIKIGDIIGYVGDTGYGPEGTSGQFVDHLHFGMYKNDIAINPYPFLKAWESR